MPWLLSRHDKGGFILFVFFGSIFHLLWLKILSLPMVSGNGGCIVSTGKK